MRHALSRRLGRIEARAGETPPNALPCTGCGGDRQVFAWQYVDGMG